MQNTQTGNGKQTSDTVDVPQ